MSAFTTHTSDSGYVFQVRPNLSKRTITIKYDGFIYKTVELGHNEFTDIIGTLIDDLHGFLNTSKIDFINEIK